MNELGLGQINPPPHDRDAVHVAVVQAVTGEALYPGVEVLLEKGKAFRCDWKRSLGVVDPFIRQEKIWDDHEDREENVPIPVGSLVWIWLKPGSIRTLRHHWTHPGIPEGNVASAATLQAEEALRTFAEELGVTYEEMLRHAGVFLDSGDEWVSWSFEGIGQPADFWQNYHLVTGDERAKGKDEGFNWFFTCGGCS